MVGAGQVPTELVNVCSVKTEPVNAIVGGSKTESSLPSCRLIFVAFILTFLYTAMTTSVTDYTSQVAMSINLLPRASFT